jgi:HSP20 family protein
MRADGNPFAFVRRFAEEMDRIFEDFGIESRWHVPSFLTRGHELLRRGSGLVPADWSPRVDLIERGDQFVIRADLPGLTKDEVSVEVTGNLLTIQGSREQKEADEQEGCQYSECSYGPFYRAIPLPEGVEASKASAEFRNGVLEVSLPAPRRAVAAPRRLEIREGK